MRIAAHDIRSTHFVPRTSRHGRMTISEKEEVVMVVIERSIAKSRIKTAPASAPLHCHT